PITLICQSTCKAFVGFGIFSLRDTYECLKTPVFRVSKVIEETDHQCYVVLELLQPTYKFDHPFIHDRKDLCHFFPKKRTKGFIRTGICITVNINCFCGIECLPAIKVHHSKPTPRPSCYKFEFINEEICGNFGSGGQTVWESSLHHNSEATIQIYNSAQSPSAIHVIVDGHKTVVFPAVPPGTTITRSMANPRSLVIHAPENTSGKYCIKLIKSIPTTEYN